LDSPTNGSAIASASGFSRRTLALIVGGLLTGLLLGALDQTIVATAGPTIISDLGGLSVYAWVFSAYILTQTVSMPIFAKLSDLYGRRRFLVLGTLIFMGGSALSGAAQSINELILFRAIQGIGSGAFFPIAIAVAGVVFPPAQRGRIQGIFASVFGVSAVLGPSAGSYLVQSLNWRWIFYVNLPLGVVSVLLISLALKESRDTNSKPAIDWLGVTTLTTWITLLMLGFLSGGSTFAWYSWEEAGLFAGAVAFFGLFLFAEGRATEPVMPLSLFRVKTISAAAAVSFLTGVAMYAVISYVPLFVQAGLGGSIDDGRNVLYAMMLPLVAGAILGGQLSTRSVGYRPLLTIGLVVMSGGLFLLTTVGTSASLTQLMEYGAIMGFGIGITFPVAILAIQYSVSRRLIGVASSLGTFTRNLGGTIGLAVLGAVQVNAFSSQLSNLLVKIPAQFQSQAAASFGNSNLVGQMLASPSVLAQVEAANPQIAQFVPALRTAFAQSLSPLFLAGLGFGLASIVAGVFVTGSFRQQVAAREELHAKEEREALAGASNLPPDMIRSED
jgi:EmrB/QacA subfamily drug resistance transporter